jgi:hypothetical protein
METIIARRASPTFRTRLEVILERRSADYHRAAAARAGGLMAEAMTRWLKEHLSDAVVRHEQIAPAIERASEPDAPATSQENETVTLSSETPGQ